MSAERSGDGRSASVVAETSVADQPAGEADEMPRPKVWKLCKGCHVTWGDVSAERVIVSRHGVAHFGHDGGMTRCGTDATGDRWWWPL